MKPKPTVLESITANEWIEIKNEAIKAMPVVKNDHFRATCYGFVNWLLKNDRYIEVEGPDKNDAIH